MEIINELLSDNIDYLNALRNAEPLPKKISSAIEPTSSKRSSFLKYTIIVGTLSLLAYIIVIANREVKKKS